MVDFDVNNAETNSFNIKEKITGKPDSNVTKNVEIMVRFKYVRNFWSTLKMPLINREINLDLNWFKNCVIAANDADQGATFSITDTKFYVSFVTLLTQDNVKPLKQLKSGFKRTINWNKYQPKVSTESQNQYLDFLLDPSFEGANRLFLIIWRWSTTNKLQTILSCEKTNKKL